MNTQRPLHFRRRSPARSRDAFTLMEVLLVLVILVVLASMAVGIFGGTQEGAYKRAAQADVGIIKNAVNLYKFATKQYPGSVEDLVRRPSDSKIANLWEGPYLERVPKDPWDNEYKIAAPGKHNSDSFDVWSLGPDGQDGTADDIGNWDSQ